MAATPAFRFYAQDFLVGVLALKNDEVGAYIKLLAYQWAAGAVPNDVRRIAKIISESGSKTRRIWTNLFSKFDQGSDGLFRNKRLEVERVKQRRYNELQKQKAVKGGRPKGRRKKPAGLAPGFPKQSLSFSSSSSLSVQKKEHRARRGTPPGVIDGDPTIARSDQLQATLSHRAGATRPARVRLRVEGPDPGALLDVGVPLPVDGPSLQSDRRGGVRVERPPASAPPVGADERDRHAAPGGDAATPSATVAVSVAAARVARLDAALDGPGPDAIDRLRMLKADLSRPDDSVRAAGGPRRRTRRP